MFKQNITCLVTCLKPLHFGIIAQAYHGIGSRTDYLFSFKLLNKQETWSLKSRYKLSVCLLEKEKYVLKKKYKFQSIRISLTYTVVIQFQTVEIRIPETSEYQAFFCPLSRLKYFDLGPIHQEIRPEYWTNSLLFRSPSAFYLVQAIWIPD